MNKELKVGIIGVIGLVFFYLGSNFLKGIAQATGPKTSSWQTGELTGNPESSVGS